MTSVPRPTGVCCRWQLCSEQVCLVPTSGVELDTRQFAGTRQLSLHATLSGGRGDTAWQHTQLFRSDILMWSVE